MKYSKLKDRPEPLGTWIDLVNDVPFRTGKHLPSWKIFLSDAYFELTSENVENVLPLPPEQDYGQRESPTYEQQKALEKAYELATNKLKEETTRFSKLYSYLFELQDDSNKDLDPDNYYDGIRFNMRTFQLEKSAHIRFERFQNMRWSLRSIAQTCMDYAESGVFVDNGAVFESLGFQDKSTQYSAKFVIENGIINYQSELIDATRNIQADRLKICSICNEIYWAKKANSKTCGKTKCVDDLQNQRKKQKKLLA